MFSRVALVAAGLAAVSCSRQTSNASPERVTLLRFENLSADPSLDWMGRAFPEVISRELAGDRKIDSISPERLHGGDQAFGRRPEGAPGVSAERTLALAAGANRLGYGEYWLGNGRLEARVTLEDLPSGKVTVIAASAPAGDVIAVAGALAGRIDSGAVPYGTQSAAALKAYVSGLESANSISAAPRFEEALALDPDFGPPYSLLAQGKVQQLDRAGAAVLLDQALARAGRMPALDRTQLALNAATLRGDAAARQQALTAWSRLTPNDPGVWRALAQLATLRHQYPQAVEAYQKALAMQPGDAVLLNELGYAAAYAGDLTAATRALQQYAAVRPGDANPLDSLGDVHLLLGRLREAESFYLQAAKKDPAFEGGGDLLKAAMARLMSGDVSAASALQQQFVALRAQAHDPLVDYYRAEWSWISGRRKEAYEILSAFARGAETGPIRQAASEAYGELAVWSVALGDRAAAGRSADQAARLAGSASARTAALARFLAQPAAAAEEWTARAERAFPNPEQKPVKDLALAYALLADRHFSEASPILRALYESGAPAPDEGLPLLLAWSDLETGKPQEAAGLLRFNPIPPTSAVRPFRVFYLPRLFYLRGQIAALAGSADQARAQFRVFLQLSGDTPLVWGEEAKAR